MIEERRWPIGSKKSVIHAGEGVIADIKWRGNYIVWANDTVSHAYARIGLYQQVDKSDDNMCMQHCIDRSIYIHMKCTFPFLILRGYKDFIVLFKLFHCVCIILGNLCIPLTAWIMCIFNSMCRLLVLLTW